MAPRLNGLKAAFKTASSRSKSSPQRPFVSLPVERPIEEETLPHYDPEPFYPVNIGNVFNDRYQVTGKLGFGAYSTSWLCQDLQYGVIVV